ncbi:MAG: hypothetical protein ACREKN_08635 [Longimicrobiaceae bacterium]
MSKGGLPVAGAPVELHRVREDTAGVVASAVSDAAGSFAFDLPPAGGDGFDVYFATAGYLGVRYFGAALHRDDPSPAAYLIEVFDTLTATLEPGETRLERREVMLVPDGRGGWEVSELLRVINPGQRTLMPGSRMFVWSFELPAGVVGFEVGQGELSPGEVERVGDRVILTRPLPPGARELFMRYRLPAGKGSARLPVSHPTGRLNLFTPEDDSPRVGGLGFAGRVSAEGERLLRYTAAELEPGAELSLRWSTPAPPPLDPALAAALVTGVVLLGGGWAASRRR